MTSPTQCAVVLSSAGAAGCSIVGDRATTYFSIKPFELGTAEIIRHQNRRNFGRPRNKVEQLLDLKDT
ncbi:MAG TPA: hypothetical protein VMF32_03485 [Xanthobacteraceae bacterium]|nr:hypothetical protein [Xanthobacteraceae bacterium]